LGGKQYSHREVGHDSRDDPNPTNREVIMSPTEIELQPNYKWRMALVFLIVTALLYLMLGYLPTIIWIAMPIVALSLIYSLFQGQSTGPCIRLDEEGLCDKRLKVGVIRWSDIRRISCHRLQGAGYISLELHNAERYEKRRPLWLHVISQVQRVFGMSSISISTSGLNMDMQSLAHRIHEGCQSAIQRA
jgi:hypothetical protein